MSKAETTSNAADCDHGDTHGFFSRPFSTAHSKAPFAVGERFYETGFSQSIDVQQPQNAPLAQIQSKYQDIRVYSNPHYGKILVLDDVLQITERDGDSYNEMMAHVPMMEHPNPKKVLVLGGGDGYVVSEVLKHSSVTHVDHVELDEAVVHICEEHFPQWAQGWKDPRVKLHIMDGSSFVANAASGHYDVIIQDSSDPHVRFEDGKSVILPSEVLFTDTHFRHCHRILNNKMGLFAMQSESFQLPDDIKGILTWRSQILSAGFVSSCYGSIYVGSYPLGQIGFLLSKKISDEIGTSTNEVRGKAEIFIADIQTVQERFDAICRESNKTKYYWPRLQESCFTLPRWLHSKIYGDEHIGDTFSTANTG